MKITIDDLSNIYDFDIIDEYESVEKIIENSDWNEKNIKLLDIAIYIVVHKPEPKYNINKDRLQSIRKLVTEIKNKYITYLKEQSSYNFFSEKLEGCILSRLGVYAKYFGKIELSDFDLSNKRFISEYKKTNLNPTQTPVSDFKLSIKDEISVILDFIKRVEETKDNLNSLYKEFRTYNQNTKNPTNNPTVIFEYMKNILIQNLKEIGLSNKKALRLTTKTITAIKKEILKI